MKIQYQDTQLTVFESTLYRTTSSVLVLDDFVLVVDPNWLPIEIACIKTHLQKVRGNRALFLLFTHSDYDHIIGYRAFEGARVIASQAFAENPNSDIILQQIRDFDDEYYVQRDYPIEYPTVDFIIKKDGQVLKIGATELTFFLANGHTNDGLFTFVNDYCFVGDYWSNIEFPYVYFSSKAYLETLGKFQQIVLVSPIQLLIPGHGDCTASLTEIEKRIDDSEAYLEALITSVQNKTPFPLEELLERYAFPKIMRKFHQGNVEILKAELK